MELPEDYYTRHLNYYSVALYVGLMTLIFLAFGKIREKREDKRKVRGHDKIEEMMESLGLKYFPKEHLLTLTQSFYTRVSTKLREPETM